MTTKNLEVTVGAENFWTIYHPKLTPNPNPNPNQRPLLDSCAWKDSSSLCSDLDSCVVL